MQRTLELLRDIEDEFGTVTVIVEEDQMGLTDRLREEGFEFEANSDEDFPAFKGEYKVKAVNLAPMLDKDTQEKLGYSLTLQIEQTLSGDVVDGRKLWRRYRTAGNDFNGNAITEDAALKALKGMLNDAFTLGVTLDTTTDETLEKSLAQVVDAVGIIRAWHFTPKGEDRKVQQFIIKQEKDLKKESKGEPATMF